MEAKAEDGLTEKQRNYVAGIAKGLASKEAARQAGFSETYAKVAGHRLSKHPAIKTELEKIREKGREAAAYTVTIAMNEALEAMQFAKAKGNAMAYCKCVELRSKLSGLMVERIEQVPPIDLRQALQDAKARVFASLAPRPLELCQVTDTAGPVAINRKPSNE